MEKEAHLTKSEKTRKFIVEQSSAVFNQKGYFGTSITDIMNATGLTKGGIYGNFASKEEIALEAFKYSVNKVGAAMKAEVDNKKTAIDKLLTLSAFYKRYVFNPPVQGGCPILNTAIEADDTNPMLRQSVLKAIRNWHRYMADIIEEGIRNDEIVNTINVDTYSSLFMAMIEGGVMLTKVTGDSSHLNSVVRKMNEIIKNELRK